MPKSRIQKCQTLRKYVTFYMAHSLPLPHPQGAPTARARLPGCLTHEPRASFPQPRIHPARMGEVGERATPTAVPTGRQNLGIFLLLCTVSGSPTSAGTRTKAGKRSDSKAYSIGDENTWPSRSRSPKAREPGTAPHFITHSGSFPGQELL